MIGVSGHPWEDTSSSGIPTFSYPFTPTSEPLSKSNDSFPFESAWNLPHDNNEDSTSPSVNLSSGPDEPENNRNLYKHPKIGKDGIEDHNQEEEAALPIDELDSKHLRFKAPLISDSDRVLSGCSSLFSLSKPSQDENRRDIRRNVNIKSSQETVKVDSPVHEQVQERLEQLNFDLGIVHPTVRSDVGRQCNSRPPLIEFELKSKSDRPSASPQFTMLPLEQPSVSCFEQGAAADNAYNRVATEGNSFETTLANINNSWNQPSTSIAVDMATRSEPGGSRRRDRHVRYDHRHRKVKTMVQYNRDRSFRSKSMPVDDMLAAKADCCPETLSEQSGPMRKHCAFVQEQELKCLFEDRVGTPHLSEMQPGDKMNAQLNIGELSVGGDVAAFSIGGQITEGLSTFEAMEAPDEA